MKHLKFILLFVLIASGCKPERLDFGGTACFGVKQVLRSGNCKAACGETAECEGTAICVTGLADSGNLNRADRQFYLVDTGDPRFRLEVKVPAGMSGEVFQMLLRSGGAAVRATGTIKGYDAPRNFSCRRQFTLYLTGVSVADAAD